MGRGIGREGIMIVTGATILISSWGVAFSRNPTHGENNLYAEFLFNAQDEVVSGRASMCCFLR